MPRLCISAIATCVLLLASITSIRAEANGTKFAGLRFGVGISLAADVDEKRIEGAEIVNGIVRVTDERDRVPRLVLEAHYFFDPPQRLSKQSAARWGLGPFLAIQNGDDEIIESLGAGVLTGLRYNADTQDSFNFGVGIMWDTSIKVLGDGIEPNRPLPSGETAVRFKTKSGRALVLLFSFSFGKDGND